jgi:fructose-1,6-bisphosphatase
VKCPAEVSHPLGPRAKLGLLHEVAPMAMLAEKGGGCASTGTERVLGRVTREHHQQVPILVGSPADVALPEGFCRRFAA